jgi:hypothetical protein
LYAEDDILILFSLDKVRKKHNEIQIYYKAFREMCFVAQLASRMKQNYLKALSWLLFRI